MTKIKLYIATSLDGYIAREDGALDWLDAIPNPEKIDYGYTDFIKTIDTVIMGRKTYEEVLGFGVDWPYPDSTTYVLTSDVNYRTKTENTKVLNEVSIETIELLKKQSKKDIWNIGGGEVITAFLNLGQIDEMILSMIPVILGSGIPLFPGSPKETSFELTDTCAFDTGIVNLSYKRK